MLAGAIGVITALAAGGLAWRTARQRQAAKALEITTPNGIVEQRFIKLGGIDQCIQLRGEDRDNPVLLVLHGGPSWPNAVFTLPLRPWEQHFTVIQWDHRGAGKTLLILQPEIVTWLVRERPSWSAVRAATGDDPVVCGQPKITRWPQATA
jgi:pimeloyl-ACP methyl ester carboxylesterase